MRRYLRSFVPDGSPISLRERVRAGLGGLVGILVTGLLSRVWLGHAATLPVLIAPMGASAVLLFAVPASPLAQPWSIIGGNLIAATVGVTAAATIPDPVLAAGIAEGCAIALMMLLRCVHPPSGAVALTAVLGGPGILHLGYGFVLWPVVANSLLLLLSALAFNNLTGRRYPHGSGAALAVAMVDAPPSTELEMAAMADIDAALRGFDQMLEIGRSDLALILRRAQLQAALRPSSAVTCAEVMTRDVVAIAPQAPLAEALALLRRHRVKLLPVTDDCARVVGVVTQTDLLEKTAWDQRSSRLPLARRLLLTLQRGRAPLGCVEDIMTTRVESVRFSMPATEVIARMADAGVHHLPVVGDDDRLLGVVTQSDVVAVVLGERAALSSGHPLSGAA